MPPIVIAAGIAAGGAIGGAALSSSAAGKAANSQADAAMRTAQLQHEDAQAALDFTKEQWGTQQRNMAPWLNAGTGAVNYLASQLGPGGQFSSVPQFQAPTAATEQNDPGYQFRLQQGMKALQASSAAKGNLFGGGTMKALTQFGQDYASNEYGKVYDRAMNDYSTKINAQNTLYNRFAGIAGTGQQAATTLGQQGQAAANNVGNILLTSGQQEGNAVQNAAAARASGYVGGANVWSNALSGIGSNAMNLYMMQQLMGGSGGTGSFGFSDVPAWRWPGGGS